MAKSAKKQAKIIQEQAKKALGLSQEALEKSRSAGDKARSLEFAVQAEIEAEKARALSQAAKRIVAKG